MLSARKWWLPVPHRPDTVQVSSITTCSGASTAIRICGTPSTTPSMQLPNSQSACSHPLAKLQRPLTW